jgi:mediator of RNA polymerase II transcription subunit 12, fungi type
LTFGEKLGILLTWSVTPLQFGDHRPFAATTVVKLWHDGTRQRASRREWEVNHADSVLQDQLFQWLDTSEVAGEPSNVDSVALLFGLLVERELFCYSSYIQRLIARGEIGLSFSDVSHKTLSYIVVVHGDFHYRKLNLDTGDSFIVFRYWAQCPT